MIKLLERKTPEQQGQGALATVCRRFGSRNHGSRKHREKNPKPFNQEYECSKTTPNMKEKPRRPQINGEGTHCHQTCPVRSPEESQTDAEMNGHWSVT